MSPSPNLAARWSRGVASAVLAVGAALLVGCASEVKLDDDAARAAAAQAEAAAREAQARAAAAATASQAGQGAAGSGVTTVDLTRDAASQDAALPAGMGRVVYFDYDSYVVRDDARPLLEAWAKMLAVQKSRQVMVEGHTDERGGREYNLALGQRRAEAVVKALALLGAGEGQMEAVSFGKERPAESGQTEEAFARNRRVELRLR